MEKKTYYFIGIKGTGMAALARVLHDQGNEVLGSDIAKETFTQGPLLKAGIQILPFDPANLKEGMTVIKGNAFAEDHPEVLRAKEMGLPVLVLARPPLPPADREFADGEALLTAIRDWESA